MLCGCGGMVDAADSKSASGDRVGVQVPSAVPPNLCVIGSDATPAFGQICLPPSKTGDVI